jgi:hypothetical protein
MSCLVSMVIPVVDGRNPCHIYRSHSCGLVPVRALRPVLSPSRWDMCCRKYNGVLLPMPMLLILVGAYLGEYSGMLPHLMNRTGLGTVA